MSSSTSGDPKLKDLEVFTPSLEKGNILTCPIGYIESCFSTKNGTPRQPSVCGLSRACLRISKSVFNNPEHSLMGLDQFSHVWILFVFHQNGHLSCKAKVKPPRLNGAKTGVFSTRSPHRPNAIGLTLAKLEKVEGGTIYLSGIDIIQGTPVLDIKPYIEDYDSPQNEHLSQREHGSSSPGVDCAGAECKDTNLTYDNTDHINPSKIDASEAAKSIVPDKDNDICFNYKKSLEQESKLKFEESKGNLPEISKTQNSCFSTLVTKQDFLLEEVSNGTTTSTVYDSLDLKQAKESENIDLAAISVASWVSNSPVATLQVRFTPHSEMELRSFKAADDRESGKTPFKYFHSPEEAKCAITTLLAADPRSVYRRKHCEDRLFYFTLDTAHITCWFGEGFAEVLRIKGLGSANEPG